MTKMIIRQNQTLGNFIKDSNHTIVGSLYIKN